MNGMKIGMKKRKIIEKEGKFYTVRGVELTRNFHTMTESEYFSMILSSLRRTTRFWKPVLIALEKARRPNNSDNKRLKYQYQCNLCKAWCPRSLVQVDHIVPCGGIKNYESIVPWLKRAHVEKGFQVLCKECHKIKTKKERK